MRNLVLRLHDSLELFKGDMANLVEMLNERGQYLCLLLSCRVLYEINVAHFLFDAHIAHLWLERVRCNFHGRKILSFGSTVDLSQQLRAIVQKHIDILVALLRITSCKLCKELHISNLFRQNELFSSFLGILFFSHNWSCSILHLLAHGEQ